jgi:hypothetical protein
METWARGKRERPTLRRHACVRTRLWGDRECRQHSDDLDGSINACRLTQAGVSGGRSRCAGAPLFDYRRGVRLSEVNGNVPCHHALGAGLQRREKGHVRELYIPRRRDRKKLAPLGAGRAFSRICRSILSLTFHEMLLIAGTVAPVAGGGRQVNFPPPPKATPWRRRVSRISASSATAADDTRSPRPSRMCVLLPQRPPLH